MPKTKFDPAANAFAFVNSWTFDEIETKKVRALLTTSIGDALKTGNTITGTLLALLGAGGKVADQIAAGLPQNYGLCGGMAYAALDYFKAGRTVPRGKGPKDLPTRATPNGTVLRDYLWKRFLDSLSTGGAGAATLAWQIVLNRVPAAWPFRGGAPWLLARSKEQWAILKKHVDAGEPWPVVLVGATKNPFDNHHVLAYGYEDPGDGTGTIYIYDMNSPGNCPPGAGDTVEQTLRVDFRGQMLTAVESCPGVRGPLRGFFCSAYTPGQPPDLPMQ